MSESSYLQEGDGIAQADEEARQDARDDRRRVNSTMKSRYDVNKAAKTGTMITCAGCAKSMLKKSYQSQFCRNKGQNNCKDRYWNNASESRSLRRDIYSDTSRYEEEEDYDYEHYNLF